MLCRLSADDYRLGNGRLGEGEVQSCLNCHSKVSSQQPVQLSQPDEHPVAERAVFSASRQANWRRLS